MEEDETERYRYRGETEGEEEEGSKDGDTGDRNKRGKNSETRSEAPADDEDGSPDEPRTTGANSRHMKRSSRRTLNRRRSKSLQDLIGSSSSAYDHRVVKHEYAFKRAKSQPAINGTFPNPNAHRMGLSKLGKAAEKLMKRSKKDNKEKGLSKSSEALLVARKTSEDTKFPRRSSPTTNYRNGKTHGRTTIQFPGFVDVVKSRKTESNAGVCREDEPESSVKRKSKMVLTDGRPHTKPRMKNYSAAAGTKDEKTSRRCGKRKVGDAVFGDSSVFKSKWGNGNIQNRDLDVALLPSGYHGTNNFKVQLPQGVSSDPLLAKLRKESGDIGRAARRPSESPLVAIKRHERRQRAIKVGLPGLKHSRKSEHANVGRNFKGKQDNNNKEYELDKKVEEKLLELQRLQNEQTRRKSMHSSKPDVGAILSKKPSDNMVRIRERATIVRKETQAGPSNKPYPFEAHSEHHLAGRPGVLKHPKLINKQLERDKEFEQQLQRHFGDKGDDYGFMTSVGKIVPPEHPIVLVGRTHNADGTYTKTVVLGTLRTKQPEEEFGSTESVVTLPSTAGDVPTKIGKFLDMIIPADYTGEEGIIPATPGRFRQFTRRMGKGLCDKTKRIAGEFVADKRQAGKQLVSKALGGIAKTMRWARDFDYHKAEQKGAARGRSSEDEDSAFFSSEDEEVDEGLLRAQRGQPFLIGRRVRPEVMTGKRKVRRADVLWHIPSEHGNCPVANTDTLNRKMREIRLDIRQSTDLNMKKWLTGKEGLVGETSSQLDLNDANEKGDFTVENLQTNDKTGREHMTHVKKVLGTMVKESRPEIMAQRYRDMVEKRPTAVLSNYVHEAGSDSRYEYMPSTKSTSSLHHALSQLSGIINIGSKVKKALNRTKGPTYDEVAEDGFIKPARVKGLKSSFPRAQGSYSFENEEEETYNELYSGIEEDEDEDTEVEDESDVYENSNQVELDTAEDEEDVYEQISRDEAGVYGTASEEEEMSEDSQSVPTPSAGGFYLKSRKKSSARGLKQNGRRKNDSKLPPQPPRMIEIGSRSSRLTTGEMNAPPIPPRGISKKILAPEKKVDCRRNENCQERQKTISRCESSPSLLLPRSLPSSKGSKKRLFSFASIKSLPNCTTKPRKKPNFLRLNETLEPDSNKEITPRRSSSFPSYSDISFVEETKIIRNSMASFVSDGSCGDSTYGMYSKSVIYMKDEKREVLRTSCAFKHTSDVTLKQRQISRNAAKHKTTSKDLTSVPTIRTGPSRAGSSDEESQPGEEEGTGEGDAGEKEEEDEAQPSEEEEAAEEDAGEEEEDNEAQPSEEEEAAEEDAGEEEEDNEAQSDEKSLVEFESEQVAKGGEIKVLYDERHSAQIRLENQSGEDKDKEGDEESDRNDGAGTSTKKIKSTSKRQQHTRTDDLKREKKNKEKYDGNSSTQSQEFRSHSEKSRKSLSGSRQSFSSDISEEEEALDAFGDPIKKTKHFPRERMIRLAPSDFSTTNVSDVTTWWGDYDERPIKNDLVKKWSNNAMIGSQKKEERVSSSAEADIDKSRSIRSKMPQASFGFRAAMMYLRGDGLLLKRLMKREKLPSSNKSKSMDRESLSIKINCTGTNWNLQSSDNKAEARLCTHPDCMFKLCPDSDSSINAKLRESKSWPCTRTDYVPDDGPLNVTLDVVKAILLKAENERGIFDVVKIPSFVPVPSRVPACKKCPRKPFEPFFPQLFQQNAVLPLATRIALSAVVDGEEKYRKQYPLYTNKDVDKLTDKMVYYAILHGVAQFTVMDAFSGIIAESRSPEMLNEMINEAIKDVGKESMADFVTDSAIGQGRRKMIVKEFLDSNNKTIAAQGQQTFASPPRTTYGRSRENQNLSYGAPSEYSTASETSIVIPDGIRRRIIQDEVKELVNDLVSAVRVADDLNLDLAGKYNSTNSSSVQRAPVPRAGIRQRAGHLTEFSASVRPLRSKNKAASDKASISKVMTQDGVGVASIDEGVQFVLHKMLCSLVLSEEINARWKEVDDDVVEKRGREKYILDCIPESEVEQFEEDWEKYSQSVSNPGYRHVRESSQEEEEGIYGEHNQDDSYLYEDVDLDDEREFGEEDSGEIESDVTPHSTRARRRYRLPNIFRRMRMNVTDKPSPLKKFFHKLFESRREFFSRRLEDRLSEDERGGSGLNVVNGESSTDTSSSFSWCDSRSCNRTLTIERRARPRKDQVKDPHGKAPRPSSGINQDTENSQEKAFGSLPQFMTKRFGNIAKCMRSNRKASTSNAGKYPTPSSGRTEVPSVGVHARSVSEYEPSEEYEDMSRSASTSGATLSCNSTSKVDVAKRKLSRRSLSADSSCQSSKFSTEELSTVCTSDTSIAMGNKQGEIRIGRSKELNTKSPVSMSHTVTNIGKRRVPRYSSTPGDDAIAKSSTFVNIGRRECGRESGVMTGKAQLSGSASSSVKVGPAESYNENADKPHPDSDITNESTSKKIFHLIAQDDAKDIQQSVVEDSRYKDSRMHAMQKEARSDEATQLNDESIIRNVRNMFHPSASELRSRYTSNEPHQESIPLTTNSRALGPRPTANMDIENSAFSSENHSYLVDDIYRITEDCKRQIVELSELRKSRLKYMMNMETTKKKMEIPTETKTATENISTQSSDSEIVTRFINKNDVEVQIDPSQPPESDNRKRTRRRTTCSRSHSATQNLINDVNKQIISANKLLEDRRSRWKRLAADSSGAFRPRLSEDESTTKLMSKMDSLENTLQTFAKEISRPREITHQCRNENEIPSPHCKPGKSRDCDGHKYGKMSSTRTSLTSGRRVLRPGYYSTEDSDDILFTNTLEYAEESETRDETPLVKKYSTKSPRRSRFKPNGGRNGDNGGRTSHGTPRNIAREHHYEMDGSVCSKQLQTTASQTDQTPDSDIDRMTVNPAADRVEKPCKSEQKVKNSGVKKGKDEKSKKLEFLHNKYQLSDCSSPNTSSVEEETDKSIIFSESESLASAETPRTSTGKLDLPRKFGGSTCRDIAHIHTTEESFEEQYKDKPNVSRGPLLRRFWKKKEKHATRPERPKEPERSLSSDDDSSRDGAEFENAPVSRSGRGGIVVVPRVVKRTTVYQKNNLPEESRLSVPILKDFFEKEIEREPKRTQIGNVRTVKPLTPRDAKFLRKGTRKRPRSSRTPMSINPSAKLEKSAHQRHLVSPRESKETTTLVNRDTTQQPLIDESDYELVERKKRPRRQGAKVPPSIVDFLTGIQRKKTPRHKTRYENAYDGTQYRRQPSARYPGHFTDSSSDEAEEMRRTYRNTYNQLIRRPGSPVKLHPKTPRNAARYDHAEYNSKRRRPEKRHRNTSPDVREFVRRRKLSSSGEMTKDSGRYDTVNGSPRKTTNLCVSGRTPRSCRKQKGNQPSESPSSWKIYFENLFSLFLSNGPTTETVIRFLSLAVIVFYAIHEEIFQVNGVFPI